MGFFPCTLPPDLCEGIVCTAKDQCRSIGVCNHVTGVCSQNPVADGVSCNDENDATVNDVCIAAKRVGTGCQLPIARSVQTLFALH